MNVLYELRRDIERAADVINRIELVRSQIQHLFHIVDDAPVRKAGSALEEKLIAIEGQLIELRMTGAGQDGVPWGSKLLGKFNYLANALMSGDFGPTNQQLEVQREFEGRLRAVSSELEALITRDVGAFNDDLRRRTLPIIMVGRDPRGS